MRPSKAFRFFMCFWGARGRREGDIHCFSLLACASLVGNFYAFITPFNVLRICEFSCAWKGGCTASAMYQCLFLLFRQRVCCSIHMPDPAKTIHMPGPAKRATHILLSGGVHMLDWSYGHVHVFYEMDHGTALGECSTRHMTPTSFLVCLEIDQYWELKFCLPCPAEGAAHILLPVAAVPPAE